MAWGHSFARRAWGAIALVAMIVAGFVATPARAEIADLGQTGSISVTLATEDGVTLEDGVLTLYQVADLTFDDGDQVLVYTDGFAGCTSSLANPTRAGLASELAAYAGDADVPAYSTATISGGSVYFGDLPVGLYLVVQTTASTGYEAVTPFVVSVPQGSNDEGWTYDVDASPKVEVVNVRSEEPETPRHTTTTTVVTTRSLPKTGDASVPVAIIAGAGVALVFAGLLILRFSGRSGRDER